MGITDSSSSESASPAADKEKHFSSDILRIELSGPNRSYFSILDLPGVFQSLTKNLTAKEKNGVRDLVSAHMRSEQSVIMCVLRPSGLGCFADGATDASQMVPMTWLIKPYSTCPPHMIRKGFEQWASLPSAISRST